MNLTTAQKSTFLTWLNANASGLSDDAAAALANTLASPAYFIWKSNADKALVDSQISKAAFTPADAVPASGSTVQITNDQLAYNNRVLVSQVHQANAQWLTQGVGTIDARNAGVRQNFKDCLLANPTGASGVNVDAGWGTAVTPGTVRLVLMRQVTNFEKLYVAIATGAGNNDVAGDRGLSKNPDQPGIGVDGLSIEGNVSGQNVSDIRGGIA